MTQRVVLRRDGSGAHGLVLLAGTTAGTDGAEQCAVTIDRHCSGLRCELAGYSTQRSTRIDSSRPFGVAIWGQDAELVVVGIGQAHTVHLTLTDIDASRPQGVVAPVVQVARVHASTSV